MGIVISLSIAGDMGWNGVLCRHIIEFRRIYSWPIKSFQPWVETHGYCY